MKVTKENCTKIKGFPCIVKDDIYGLGRNREGFISAIDPKVGFTISDLETEEDLFCFNFVLEDEVEEFENERSLVEEAIYHILNVIEKTGKIAIDDYKNTAYFVNEKRIDGGEPICGFK